VWGFRVTRRAERSWDADTETERMGSMAARKRKRKRMVLLR
jgi:hypothetical protein